MTNNFHGIKATISAGYNLNPKPKQIVRLWTNGNILKCIEVLKDDRGKRINISICG